MGRQAEILWRRVGTGFFLAAIGLGSSALALTLFPFVSLVTRDQEARRRRIQRIIYRSFQLYCWSIALLRIADIEIVNGDRLQDAKGMMIISNHPSLLDVVLIMSVLPRVQCVVKGGLWNNPFFRLTVEGAGYIRNDLDPMALMDECVASLRRGNNIILFPEGTRTVPGQPICFTRGFAYIALAAGADLQIITIVCEPPALFKNNPWWKVPERRPLFRLEVGPKLKIVDYSHYSIRSLAARKLHEKAKSYYKES